MRHSCILYTPKDGNEKPIHSSSFIVHRYLPVKTKILFITCLFGLLALPSFAAEQGTNEMSRDSIRAAFAKMDADNKYTDQLSYVDMNVLPIGIKQTISNNEFTLAISSMRLYERYAEVTVFARMKLDQHKDFLFFAASGVKFSYEGSFIGDAKLALVGDFDIKINEHSTLTLHGGSFDTNTGTVSGNKITSVSVDCSGLKELALSASLSFSKDFITRISDNGVPEKEPVSADFFIAVNDWSNLLVELSFPRFQINDLEGFVFDLSNVVFDFSDHRNSNNVVFPTGYMAKYLIAGAPELWRGVYAETLKVTLPRDFSKNGEAISFSAEHFLIDDNGISGVFAGENILPIDVGDASGWAFSINKFWLEMEAHKVTRGGFDGLIGLPVSEDQALLEYSAQIMGKNQYQLVASPKDSLSFDLFSATATLNANSSVTIAMINGRFLPEANLSGYMTVRASLSESDQNGNGVKMENIEFRELCLKTQNPYISVGYMGYKGEIKLFNLPVSISKVELTAQSDRVKLGFNLNLNLDEQFISASTRLEISGVHVTENNRHKWKYNGVNISEVVLDNCNIAGLFTLEGKLRIMKNDPTYGDGFYGEIELAFQKVIQGFGLTASAAFGEKDGSRYWFVDGSIGLPITIPIAGVVGINGFAGGVSKGMQRTFDGGLGLSKTGCGYIPDNRMGLGVKAGVLFASTDGHLMNGDAAFEVLFNASGGINTIGFYGFLEFAADIPGLGNLQAAVTSQFSKYVNMENDLVKGSIDKMRELESKKNNDPTEAAKETTDSESKASQASIAASVGILYNFSERTLHASFDFYVNVLGGVVRGTASGNRAGYGVLHISPEKWYVLLGTPDDPVGLQIGIPGIATVTATSYFMMGDDIPGSPPPPDKVVRILGDRGEKYDYMRSLNDLGSGRGLAFGSSLDFSTGDLTFLILYARFEMGTGFDVMLKDYGAAQCRGHSGPIGINGWYANGQAYAYMSGELGVKVNLKFIKMKYPVIKGGAAMLLQAKLPNPTWFGGAMAVQFSVLNGAVQGRMKFEFSVGDECEIVYPGTSPLEISMISDLKPSPNASEVDVFTAPQLALTAAVGQSFPVEEEDGKKDYRISLNKFIVKDGSNILDGEIKWNRDMTIATFYPHEVLPPNKQLSIEVAVGFEEYVNNRWSIVYTSGQKAEELRDVAFTTGEAPDYIPLHNVEYAYPLVDQQYYYPQEATTGYVQLERGQSYLFPPSGWKYSTQIDREGKSYTIAYTYDSGKKRVNYTLPDLSISKAYTIEFLCIPEAKAGNDASNQVKETVLLDEGENKVVQVGAAADDVIREGEGKVILEYSFLSSKYKKFSDKMDGLKLGAYQINRIGSNVIGLGWNLKSVSEEFEDAEVYGTEASGNKPLIQATADLNDKYYKEHIYPLMYQDYPISSTLRLDRDGFDEVGIPPLHGFGKWMESGKFPIRYELPKYYFYDFGELRNKYADAGNYSHPLLMAPYYPDILSGFYTTTLQYVLPGGEKGTQVKFDYKIDKQ
jgi:hypothetical protein